MNDQINNQTPLSGGRQPGSSDAGSNIKYKTVIGLFNSVAAAQTVVEELEKAAISRNQIELVTRQASPNSQLAPVSSDQNDYERFFNSLFSSPTDAAANLDAARNSNAIVAVYTNSPEQTQIASAILKEYNTDNLNAQSEISAQSRTSATPLANFTQNRINESKAHPLNSEENQPGSIVREKQANNLNQTDNFQRVNKGEIIREHKLTNVTSGLKDFTTFRPGVIELVEFSEVPVIKKIVRVVEEVSVQKIVEQHEGTIQDTVRRTEVDIQNLNRHDLNTNQ